MWNWFKKVSGITSIVSAVLVVGAAVACLFIPPSWPVFLGMAIGTGISLFSGGVYLGNNNEKIDQASQRHQITEQETASNIESIKAKHKQKKENMAEAANEAKATIPELEILSATVARQKAELETVKLELKTSQDNRDADRLANARQFNSLQQQINSLTEQRGILHSTTPSNTPSSNPDTHPSPMPGLRRRPTRNQGTPSNNGLFSGTNATNNANAANDSEEMTNNGRQVNVQNLISKFNKK